MGSATSDRRMGLTGDKGMKAPVDCATTANITLSGEQTIDGVVTLVSRVLVKNQTNAVTNGIYDSSSAAWTRAIDANGNQDIVKGTTFVVTGGTVNAGRYYQVASSNPITVDSSSITFSQALSSAASSLSFVQSGAGAVVRDMQTKGREIISVKDFGAVGDGAADDTAAIALWKVACDALGAEGLIPDGTFKITADAELPAKVRCFGTITGAFYVLYQKRQNGYVHGLTAAQFKLRGCFFCTVSELKAPLAVVDGFSNAFGTFWNNFDQWRVDVSLTVDITNWSINLNKWSGGRIGYCNLTGNTGTYAGTEAHANTWDGVDFTSPAGPLRGMLQDDAKRQVNFIRSCYFEAGSDIVGNFHVFGQHGDQSSPMHTDRFTHMLGATGVNQLNSKDFLSASVCNLVRGGNWDWLDTSLKPVGFGNSGGASVAVTADTTEPCGIGKRYQCDFADAFDNFGLTIQPSGVNRFGVVIYYKSTADFVAIESNDGTGAVSHTTTAVVIDVTNNWKMLRLSGPASKTATTSVTLFAYAGSGGATKTMSLGGVFAGSERAVIFPTNNDIYASREPTAAQHVAVLGGTMFQAGVVSQGNVGGATVDTAIAFQEAFGAAPQVTFSYEKVTNTSNLTRGFIKAGSITTAGFTVTSEFAAASFDANIRWHAIGRR